MTKQDGDSPGMRRLRDLVRAADGGPASPNGLLLRLIDSLHHWRPAPREIPPDFVTGFAMGGQVPIHPYFRDDTFVHVEGEGADVRIRLDLESMVYTRAQVDDIISQVQRGRVFHYGATDTWLYQALADYSVMDQRVAVIGSGCPVYEAICLAYGGHPVTVEYQTRITDDDRLEFWSPDDFAKSTTPIQAAFSVSSFEHDGLGRYGDPLDPDGDLKAMRSLSRRLAAGGLLYLTVPFHHDAVIWNVNRHYGSIRLPHLLAGWTLIGVYGPPEGLFRSLSPLDIDAEAWRRYFDELGPDTAPEWVLVLRNDQTHG